METHKTFETIPLKNGIFLQETIDTLIFNHLVSNLKLDPDSSLDLSIGFSSEHAEWSMTFYAESGSDFHRVVVQDFGFMINANGCEQWIQCRPTSEQISVLQSIIDKKVDDLENHYAEEEKRRRSEASFDVRSEQGLYCYGY